VLEAFLIKKMDVASFYIFFLVRW